MALPASILEQTFPTMSLIFLIAALGAALLDWVAVSESAPRLRRMELVAKPAVPLLLIGAAATASFSNGAIQVVLIGALALSCVGDVALMLPDPKERLFIVGLSSFLVAHVLFVVALLAMPHGSFLVGIVVAVAIGSVPSIMVLRSIARTAPELLGPVAVYCLTITVMAGAAVASGLGRGGLNWVVVVGGLSFVASDLMLAINRFVRPLPRAALIVHVTYHVAIAGLTIGILTIP